MVASTSNKPTTITQLRQQGINPYSLLPEEKASRSKGQRTTPRAQEPVTAPASEPPPRALTVGRAGKMLAGVTTLSQVASTAAQSTSLLFKSPDGKFYDLYDNAGGTFASPIDTAMTAVCGSQAPTRAEWAQRLVRDGWSYLRGTNVAEGVGFRAERAGASQTFEACGKAVFDEVYKQMTSSPSTDIPGLGTESKAGLSPLAVAAIAGFSILGTAAVVGVAFCVGRRVHRNLADRTQRSGGDLEVGLPPHASTAPESPATPPAATQSPSV